MVIVNHPTGEMIFMTLIYKKNKKAKGQQLMANSVF